MFCTPPFYGGAGGSSFAPFMAKDLRKAIMNKSKAKKKYLN